MIGAQNREARLGYRSGLSRTWVKAKNTESAAVRREREEEWR
jgi:hypothetical protein